MNTLPGNAAKLGAALIKWAVATVTAAFFFCPQGLAAAPMGAEICLEAANSAALAHDIPPSALRRLAVEQSGKLQDGEKRPWPWTVEADGIRRWFSDRQSASDFVDHLRGQGAGRVKMGCFLIGSSQIPTDLADGEAPLAPAMNAQLAARALAGRYKQTGSWDAAIRGFGAVLQSASLVSAPPEPSTNPIPSPPPAETAAPSGHSAVGSLISFGADGTAFSFWQETE